MPNPKQAEEGLDYFVYSVNEKINVGNYSSVDTFASLGRNIEDTDETRQAVIDVVEKVLEIKREEVVALLEKG